MDSQKKENYNTLPLCGCGCGQNVTKLKNVYIQGHNIKNISDETKKKLSILKKGKTWEEIYGEKYAIYFKEKRKNDLKGKTYEELHGIKKAQLIKEKISEKNKGKQISETHKKAISKAQKNKIVTNKSKEKMRKSSKLSIEQIIKRYPLFYKIEEIRYNPDKPGEKEIQVRCKNHSCKNSKERDGWFTPNINQLRSRILWLEKEGKDNSYMYCSDDCKTTCPLYGLQNDPLKINKKQQYTQAEYNIFREFVLERDNYICQYCGKLAEHVHHERPQKLEPFYSLDPDLAWSVCKECHYERGHKDKCSTGSLANKECQ